MPTPAVNANPAPPLGERLYTPLAILFSLLWASAFMAVKVGLRSSPPLFLMGFRFLLAGSLLMALALIQRRALPATRREWVQLGIIGVLNNAGYLGLASLSMRHLSGGMGAVLASANPLMLAMVAPLFLRERLTPVKLAGFVIAFGSVVAVMYSRMGAENRPAAMALMFAANSLMVAGTILFKRWQPKHDLFVVNGVQLLTASAALLAPSLWLEPVGAVAWTGDFLLAMTYLVLGVSCGAMLIWFLLLRSGDASRASAFFFLNPILGLFLGALLLGEPLQWLDVVGGAGVGLGIHLAQRQS